MIELTEKDNKLNITVTDNGCGMDEEDAVLAFETEIAKVSVDRATLRDVHKNYNKMSVQDITSKHGFIDWELFFKETGISKSEELNAGQIAFF